MRPRRKSGRAFPYQSTREARQASSPVRSGRAVSSPSSARRKDRLRRKRIDADSLSSATDGLRLSSPARGDATASETHDKYSPRPPSCTP